MPELGGNQFLKERMLGSGGHGNVAAVGERNHAQSIFQSLLCGDVAGNDSDGAHVEFRRIQGQHQGHGIVGARVGIEDDFLGRAGGGRDQRQR